MSPFILRCYGQNAFRTSLRIALVLALLLPIHTWASNPQNYNNPPVGINSTAAWGQYVTLNYSVVNTGTATTAGFQIEFFLSSTSTINPTTNYLWYTIPVSTGLPPNTYVAGPVLINLPGSIPTGLSNGTVYVGMAIVQNGTVIEVNQGIGKDIASFTATAPLTLPDLIGFNGAPYGANYEFAVQQTSATWGQTLGVQQAVLNQSVVSSGPFTGNIYISETNHFVANSSSCYCIGSFTNTATLPGGAIAYSGSYVNYQLPTTNPFGDNATTFYVGMVINPNQTVAEANYANNANQGAGIDMGAQAVTITRAQPQISVTNTSLLFGNVGVNGPSGETATQTLAITNNGALPLNISNISTSGAPFSVSSVQSTITTLPNPNTYPATIQPDGLETWLVTVSYNPTVVGSQTGTLVISSNDPTTPNVSVSLSGTGVAVPNLVLTDPVPPSNDMQANFGNVVNDGAGGASSSLTFTLKNTGSGTGTISPNGIFLTNPQGTVWSITSITSNTQGAINLYDQSANIQPNNAETWSIVVKFDPTANTSYETSLSVVQLLNFNTGGTSIQNCTLTGTGMVPGTISVASSLGTPTNVVFGSVHATGNQKVTATLTLTNTGSQPLIISQNGIGIANTTNFQILSIQSSTQGAINLATGTATISPNGAESWTVTVVFDPVASGSLSTQLTILSNDPLHGSDSITLSGTGLNQPGILVTNSSSQPSNTFIPFGPVLNDGASGRTGTQTVSIQNVGLQPVVIPANGIALSNAPGFSIQSISSSTQTGINLASVAASGGTIAPNQSEKWTVALTFDPTSNTSYSGTLGITSNDPVNPSIAESLAGSGTTPTITVLPQTASLPTLYIPAGQVYNISWNAAYTAGTATITLFTDTDTNPASGLVQLTSIPFTPTSANPGSYSWRPSTSLVGDEFYIYGTIQDGTVSNGSYSTQKIHVEAQGSFNLLSGLVTTNSNYTYQYIYNGATYTGTTTLQPGANLITITTPVSGGGTVAHQVTVTKVASLLAVQGYTYDEMGRVKTYTNGNGIVTSNTYDAAGNLVQTSASNGNIISYTFDNAKRKLSMSDATGTTYYDYDDLDRISDIIYSANNNKTDPTNLTLTYQYDNGGRETDVTYPGGEHVKYAYDDAGRLTGVDDLTLSENTTYNYNYTTGLLHSVVRANGVTTTYGYDGLGNVNDVQHKLGSQLLAEYNYTLNASGMVTSLLTTFADGSQKQEVYTYDGLNRLVQVVYGATATATANDKTVIYTYDGVGNRLSATTKVNGSVTTVLTYNYSSENRLTTIINQSNVTQATYYYDAAGNRIEKITPSGTTYYSYDERNLLTAVLTPSDYVTYTYNGLAQRVYQSVDGLTTRFVIDPLQDNGFKTVQDMVGANVSNSYVYGVDRLERKPSSGGSAYYLPDRLGSVRLVTDGSGNILSSYSYDAYGNAQ